MPPETSGRARDVKLPTGTVTFLFTDIEGSTRLLRALEDDYRAVQDDQMRLIREAIAEGGGTEIRTEGDAFFVVFPTAAGAVRAAVAAQRSFASHRWSHRQPLRVRMGMHTGEGRLGGDDYLGIDVNRAARIAAAGHGGQVLVSEATRALVADVLPEGVTLADLGEHRLKDFDAPGRIHQLLIDGLPTDFPPLRTLDTPTNLPVELTSFVGREQELEEIQHLLDSTRLLTLTGPGGSGKTRLALRAASLVLDRFPGGVYLVELASVSEAHLVPSVIASAVGTGEQGPRSVIETLQIELRHRTALLVLDNFEQVIEASSAVTALLSAAPAVRFLVTSRGPLRIQGEQEFPVPPLRLPDPARLPSPEDLTRFEALALFVDRATAIDPHFAVKEENMPAVVEICRRLDGLPLAIELAASRLRLLSPTAMLERLDKALPFLAGGSRDLPDRQRTLRGAIGWSYDLLSPAVAGLFRRLCVFAGGFTMEAAEATCDPDGELGIETMDGLEALLDAGLVRRRPAMPGDDRFDTLQTVREYGLERLVEHDEAPAIRRRHALYFLELAEAAEPGFRGPDLGHHLQLLHLEHDNLRAALAWALEADEGEVALRMVSALWRFWHLHGDLTAGRRWVEQALALPSASARSGARARALIAAGSLAYWQLDPPRTSASYEEALAIFGELGYEAGIANATYNMAFGLSLEGKVSEAGEMFRTSRGMFEALGDRRGVADSLFGLGLASRLQGDLGAARTTGEEALRMHEDLEDVFGVYGSLYMVGRAAAEQADLDAARAYFLRALDMAEKYGDRTGVALSLDNLADQELGRGRPARAMKLAGASEAIKEGVGGQAPPELVLLADPRERAREVLSEKEIDAAWQKGRAMPLDEALAFAREET
jgi:predicted ATPase/class 3 adenylate cyclase